MGSDNMEEWEEMENEVNDQIKELFAGGLLTDLVVRKRDKMVVPRILLPMLNTIRELKVREDDIFILSYPKCGTTLTMELAWLSSHQADIETAKQARGSRCSFLEGPAILGMSDWEHYYTKLASLPSPRVFNSQLRFDMLPKDTLKGKL